MYFGNKAQLWAMGLLALVSASAASEAALLEMGNNGIFNKRQDTTAASSDRVESSLPPASTPPAQTPSPPASSPGPSTPTPTPSSDLPPVSVTIGDSSPSPSPTPSPDVPTSDLPPSSEDPGETAVFSTFVTPLVTTRTSQVTRVTVFISDGQSVTSTFTSDTVEAITTGTATSVARLAGSDNKGGSSGGISESSKKVIGGVVGGVGGALLIGGIVLVFLRMRKRNRTNVEIDEYNVNNLPAEEKRLNRQSAGGNTQFQSTLDQYHVPTARPNAAANF